MARFMSLILALVVWGCAGMTAGHNVVVEFRWGDGNPGPGLKEMAVSGRGSKVYLSDVAFLTNADVASARVRTNLGRREVAIALTPAAKKKFADATRANVHRRLGILVDGKLVSAPEVLCEIPDGRVTIAGAFSEEEAERIAAAFPKE